MNRLKFTAGISTLAMGLLFAAAPAGAQVYNPGPTTTQAGGNQNAGTLNTGQTTVIKLCGYPPSSTETVTFDGQTVPSQVADSSGCVTFTVTVASSGTALGPAGSSVRAVGARSAVVGLAQAGFIADQLGRALHAAVPTSPKVVINGVTFTGSCGTNTLVASGSGVTHTATFSINCASLAATPTSGGGLPFTGANIMKLGGAAGLLILFGAGLVAVERRRSRLQG